MITLPTLPIFESRKAATASTPAIEANSTRTTTLRNSPSTNNRSAKVVSLSQLGEGETGRIVRVAMDDAGCRRRFAELGIAEGMKVTVAGVGETLLLIVGTSRMGLGKLCAQQVQVMRM